MSMSASPLVTFALLANLFAGALLVAGCAADQQSTNIKRETRIVHEVPREQAPPGIVNDRNHKIQYRLIEGTIEKDR